MLCTYSPPYTAHLEKPGTTHAHNEYDNNLEGPPLLVSVKTVPNWGCGGKAPARISEHHVQCHVRLG